MGRSFKKRGIAGFLLCLLVIFVIFGLNRFIQPKHLSNREILEKRSKMDSNNHSLLISIADTYYKNAIHISSPHQSPIYLKRAISLYKKALKIEKNPKTAFYLGRAYFDMAKYSKKKDKFYHLAEKNFLFAYKNGFVNKELLTFIGHTYLISGNLNKAIEFYEKALKLFKKDPISLLNLAFCYKENQELDKALECLKAIDEPKEKELFINLHLQLGRIYEKKGYNLLARKEYLLVLEKDKKNKEAKKAIKRLY